MLAVQRIGAQGFHRTGRPSSNAEKAYDAVVRLARGTARRVAGAVLKVAVTAESVLPRSSTGSDDEGTTLIPSARLASATLAHTVALVRRLSIRNRSAVAGADRSPDQANKSAPGNAAAGPGPLGRLRDMLSWPAAALPVLPGDAGATPLRLFDSALREQATVRVDGPTARLYVCGITPYDATHLGHAATYLAFDTLVRVWRDRGLAVDYVQNVTDIDDPLLERAIRDGQDWRAVAERETTLFREDMTALRVLPPTHYVGAVEAMDEIAAYVMTLLDAGAAYRLATPHGDDFYFPVATAAHFGQVAGLDPATMLALSAERGGDPQRAGKKDPLDALLWLAARPGEPSWPSPLGPGRPGWHVECTAIALNRLGSGFDVQGGGADLLFPHHELSAAHGEVGSGQWPFARAYVHAGMVGLDGEKMSKSRGNLVFVSTLRAGGTDPGALRLALLAAPYRADREWTSATLARGEQRLAAWQAGMQRPSGASGTEVLAAVRAALANDLDTPTALALIDAWCAADGADPDAPALVTATVDALLGVALSTPSLSTDCSVGP